MNILRSYLNWWHNWQLKSRRRSHTLKGSHSMGDGQIFIKKPAATFPLINSYRMSLLSAGSILLDSIFKPFDWLLQSYYLPFGFGKHSMWRNHWVFEQFCIYFVLNLKQENFKWYKFHIYRISPLPTVIKQVGFDMVHCPLYPVTNVGHNGFYL